MTHSDMAVIDAAETGFRALLEKITRDRGFQCASYKDKCVRRRVAVRMRAKAVLTYDAYSAMLDLDPREYERLLSALTINVTKFFRNWEAYSMLASRVIPEIWSADARPIRVWSAGCASGEEAYSIAVLFHRHAKSLGEEADLSRVEIIATDVDDESLAVAERAVYGEGAFADTPVAIREEYFPAEGPLRTLIPEVKRMVTFGRRDVLTDAPPAQGLRFIVCRNVVIYFDRPAQERLFENFHEALLPGGFMMLGKVETLLGKSRDMFAPVSAKERIFRSI